MPSELVVEVRRLIRRRTEEGRPLTMPERALLLATLAPPRRTGGDVVDELEAAIAAGRRHLFTTPTTPADVDATREAARRLLAAARAVLDYAPAYPDDFDPAATAPLIDHGGRPERADVDG